MRYHKLVLVILLAAPVLIYWGKFQQMIPEPIAVIFLNACAGSALQVDGSASQPKDELREKEAMRITFSSPVIKPFTTTSIDSPPLSAVKWAITRVGDAGWWWGCLRFVANAYDQQQAGWRTAALLADILPIHRTSPAQASIGALVFWGRHHSNNYAGHIGLHIGRGYVIHIRGKRVVKNNMAHLQPGDYDFQFTAGAPYLGWGKTPANWRVGNGGRSPDISGRVTTGDQGVANVTITIRGPLKFGSPKPQTLITQTDANGYFTFWGLPIVPPDGSAYTVTAEKSDLLLIRYQDRQYKYERIIEFITPVVRQNKTIIFPDPNLERIIRWTIDRLTGPIFRSDLIGVTRLVGIRAEITNLRGIEYLTNLNRLFLFDNRITDLAPLVANPGLGAGDRVFLQGNPLDLRPGSQNMHDIEKLRRRGVEVIISPALHNYCAGPARGQ
ncbi:hypothetical protein LR021_02205 [Candidatus Bipolaricaulota bacterium]|nr:hypothetical protein [Candidatus Bipolaricaulota bacterium]